MKPIDNQEKFELNNNQIAFFRRNFNRKAYDQAKQQIQDAIDKSHTFLELWNNLGNLEKDVKYMDLFSEMLVEIELDRSHMETDADYVGVSFFIYWNEKKNTGRIQFAELYSSENDKQETKFCYGIDPETCEIVSLEQIDW